MLNSCMISFSAASSCYLGNNQCPKIENEKHRPPTLRETNKKKGGQ